MKPIQNIADAPLSALDKGVPSLSEPLDTCDVAAQNWNVLAEDIPLPCAVFVESAVRNNSRWMKAFLETAEAELAPHGKTTMAPAIFQLQMNDGAWGVTVSTFHQLRVARHFGYNRIFYANQLVGKAAISYVVSETARDPSFDFLFLVDSIENFLAIDSAAAAAGTTRSLKALVELGYIGGRTGCRTEYEALTIARAIHESRPEIDKLIVAFGKRDISYDDQPVLLKWFRPDGGTKTPRPIGEGHNVTRLNDQHAHLTVPADSPLRVGDLVCFGISHPCLTFDKWRVIHVVDDDYNVMNSIRTYF